MNEKVVPGSDIAPVVFPHVPPENNVGKYFESKLQDEKTWAFPDWDVCRAEPNMDLIYARRELFQADTFLAIKRKAYIKDREILDAEWQDLADKEESLRKSFIMFHKFVKENQEKKDRASRRIHDEKLIHDRRDEEIYAIEEKIEKMCAVRESLELSVKNLKIYEDYLSDVIAISPEYRSITSILNRYDALSTARNDLVTRQKIGLEELEKERIAMMELIEERVGVLMGLNNQVADLQFRYDKAKHQARYWERVVNKVKSKSASELLKIYLIKDSVWNLYQLMCMRKGVEIEIKKNNVEEQLMYIKGTISEYKRITKIASKKVVKDVSSLHTNSAKSNNS